MMMALHRMDRTVIIHTVAAATATVMITATMILSRQR